MLGLAAKAAGFTDVEFTRGVVSVYDRYNEIYWNPLVDDGDAFRLAIKLGIEVIPDASVSEVSTAFCVRKNGQLVGLNEAVSFGESNFSEANDALSAAKLVIVRSAAKIGSSL